MSENDSSQDKLKEKLFERHSEASLVRKIVLIISILIFLVISGIAAGGYLYVKSALEPVDPENNNTIDISIPIGSSVTSIANILEENDLIKSSKIFRYYIKFKNESGFQAGDYQLSPAMTFDQIIASLKTGKVVEEIVFKLTIPEGKQLTQIATIIAEKTGHEQEEVMEKMTDSKYIETLMARYPSILTEEILAEDVMYPLEGYLFPATYAFYKEDPAIEEVIETMLDKTAEVLTSYTALMAEREITPLELLTMASLIEEEATDKTDRELISSVFYNRIEIGMPLQTDPTVLYALGEHKDRTLYEDLKVDSPYNTYIIQGLPPGPIANAGEISINAALNPAATDYLYFLATSSGEVKYSKTLEEHNQKKALYIGNE